jgi:hypothetical protein
MVRILTVSTGADTSVVLCTADSAMSSAAEIDANFFIALSFSFTVPEPEVIPVLNNIEH